MRLVFSVIRFVPDAARGEFVNVGIILGSDEASQWRVRRIDNLSRARSLSEDPELVQAVSTFAGEVEAEIGRLQHLIEQPSLFEHELPVSEEWLWDNHGRMRNLIQLSRPTPMIAESVAVAADRLWDQFIVDPDRRSFAFKKKNEALAAIRRAYKGSDLPSGAVHERTSVATERFRQQFDFTVANGKALQLSHAWSFQVPDQEGVADQIKAWGWTVRDIRLSGGIVEVAQDRHLEVPPNVDVQVVYIPPARNEHSLAFESGRAVFEELEVPWRPASEAEMVGSAARSLLAAAGQLPANKSVGSPPKLGRPPREIGPGEVDDEE